MSRISVRKLQDVLSRHRFFADRFFVNDGNCMFVEVISTSNGIRFLIEISSGFEMPISPSEITFDILSLKNPTERIAKRSEIDLAEDYSNVTPIQIDSKQDLDDTYRVDVTSQNVEIDVVLYNILEQNKRLNFTTKSSRFTLAIIYENYIITDKTWRVRDNTSILDTNNSRRLLPVVQVNHLLDDIETLSTTLYTLKLGVARVLALNFERHIQVMQSLSQKTASLLKTLIDVQNKLARYKSYRESLMEISLKDQGSDEDVLMLIEDLLNLDEVIDNSSLGVDALFYNNIVSFTNVLNAMDQL